MITPATSLASTTALLFPPGEFPAFSSVGEKMVMMSSLVDGEVTSEDDADESVNGDVRQSSGETRQFSGEAETQSTGEARTQSIGETRPTFSGEFTRRKRSTSVESRSAGEAIT